jgi:hypothetical protein
MPPPEIASGIFHNLAMTSKNEFVFTVKFSWLKAQFNYLSKAVL